jgi:ATP-dependent DNA helicase RecQ
MNLKASLQELFGFGAFRPHQEEAVRAAVLGQDLLVVMPTGAGKSLCFQMPAALTQGVTLVVSPLIALMRDQIDALTARPAFARIGCAAINSNQSLEEQAETLDRLRAGAVRLLYVAPERFRSQSFMEALRAVKVARFVVDEAHCVSEWGHDFRPDYLALRPVIEALGRPPITAVTATATRRVQQAIVRILDMRKPLILAGGFNRPNLHFSAHYCRTPAARLERVAKALPKLAGMGGSGLVYAATRRQCEEVAALAAEVLGPLGLRAEVYHAGMEPADRAGAQNRWLAGQTHLLVATNAFGMGIDKPDVRYVVHCGYPDSLEGYYQEAGRAGRDGLSSRCAVLYTAADRKTREWFIENEALKMEDVHAAHAQVCRAAVNGVARLPRDWWRSNEEWSETKGRLTLSELERAGVTEPVSESGAELALLVLHREMPAGQARQLAEALRVRTRERYRRLEEMLDYCRATTCRHAAILDYFGDSAPPTALGRCCDNCDRPPAGPTDTAALVRLPRERVAMPAIAENADIHTLLHGLDALRPSLGMARLNKLLRGSSAKDMEAFQRQNCPLMGTLKHCSRDQVNDLLNGLVEEGLLLVQGESEYFVCAVTQAGREAWQNKTTVATAIPSKLPARAGRRSGSSDWDAPIDDPEASDLFQKLQGWRRRQAREEGVPGYCVLPDRALWDLIRARPSSRETLLKVNGIGPAKVEKYGGALLGMVRRRA